MEFGSIRQHPSTKPQVTTARLLRQSKAINHRLSLPRLSRAVELLTALLWHQHPLQPAFVHKCPGDTRMSWCKIVSGQDLSTVFTPCHMLNGSLSSPLWQDCHALDLLININWIPGNQNSNFPWSNMPSSAFAEGMNPVYPGTREFMPGWWTWSFNNRLLKAKDSRFWRSNVIVWTQVTVCTFPSPSQFIQEKASWGGQDIWKSSNWALMHWSPIARRTRSSFSCYIKSGLF